MEGQSRPAFCIPRWRTRGGRDTIRKKRKGVALPLLLKVFSDLYIYAFLSDVPSVLGVASSTDLLLCLLFVTQAASAQDAPKGTTTTVAASKRCSSVRQLVPSQMPNGQRWTVLHFALVAPPPASLSLVACTSSQSGQLSVCGSTKKDRHTFTHLTYRWCPSVSISAGAVTGARQLDRMSRHRRGQVASLPYISVIVCCGG